MDDYKGQVKLSSEKQFVYHDSVNRGHVQLPRMIVHCLMLSATAKIAYGVISGYVFEHGKSAFPSMKRIARACGVTPKTATKYIDELVDKGFIIRERNGNGRTNTYYIVDADKIEHLHVSEMFWRVFNEVKKELEPKFYDDLDDKFDELLDCIMRKEGIEFKRLPVNSEMEAGLQKRLLDDVKEGSRPMLNLPNRGKKLPDTIENVLGDDALNGKGKFLLPDDVDRWTNNHFVTYFYRRYLSLVGKPHEEARAKHRGMLGRVIRNLSDSKTKARQYIDTFFQMGYESPSIEIFSTTGRMTEIETYLSEGKKPYYLQAKEKKEMVETAEQENKGMSAEAFLKRIMQE
ncbi:hypothetical protein SECTIM467_152 [Brevibacillus phage SecTim467]|uniref:Helix-turn-helix domain-containing protein n=2 Tax=Jenstvirus jenst TaxID=1982225 RepID=A0A0K2CNS5_9CAUD|nr:hypothetical protein AVV11_gp044 [Brevibacillus phage Jenst]ALA07276.1 hypothetical protein JENST_147 [Brevibacillus phage Jenst]ALA07477.1 hypothetical protein SECTIM467_152 [Brevibacillus phage SecTim467]